MLSLYSRIFIFLHFLYLFFKNSIISIQIQVPGEELPLSLVLDIIDKMPKIPSPDALGLNDNSAVLKHTADTESLLQGVVLTSPTSSSGKDSKEDDNKAKKQSSKSKDATSKVRFLYLVTSGTYMSLTLIRISSEC